MNNLINRRQASLIALHDLLIKIVSNPDKYVQDPIVKHLKSQGALAQFNCEPSGIHGSSLNTLKRNATTLSGGFDALDRMRRQALAAIDAEAQRQKNANRTTKVALRERAQTLRDELASAREDLVLMSRLLDRALRQGIQYANESGSPALQARSQREQAEILDMMSLRQTKIGRFKLIRSDSDAQAV